MILHVYSKGSVIIHLNNFDLNEWCGEEMHTHSISNVQPLLDEYAALNTKRHFDRTNIHVVKAYSFEYGLHVC